MFSFPPCIRDEKSCLAFGHCGAAPLSTRPHQPKYRFLRQLLNLQSLVTAHQRLCSTAFSLNLFLLSSSASASSTVVRTNRTQIHYGYSCFRTMDCTFSPSTALCGRSGTPVLGRTCTESSSYRRSYCCAKPRSGSAGCASVHECLRSPLTNARPAARTLRTARWSGAFEHPAFYRPVIWCGPAPAGRSECSAAAA